MTAPVLNHATAGTLDAARRPGPLSPCRIPVQEGGLQSVLFVCSGMARACGWTKGLPQRHGPSAPLVLNRSAAPHRGSPY